MGEENTATRLFWHTWSVSRIPIATPRMFIPANLYVNAFVQAPHMLHLIATVEASSRPWLPNSQFRMDEITCRQRQRNVHLYEPLEIDHSFPTM